MQYKDFKKKKNEGFVILFAVTISSILLAIALGISNIAIKEVKFSTSAKDTNDAFFAADTGIEYVLFHDKNGDCTPESCSLSITGLGSTEQSCVNVTFSETGSSPVITTIISKGYNTGENVSGVCTPGINSVERELRVSYSF